MAEMADVDIKVNVKLGLWSAIKLRIAGKKNVPDELIDVEID